MARATNAEVIKAFIDGRDASSLSLTSTHYPQMGTLAPRGFLRSYNQLIARYDEGHGFLVFDFTASGEYISQTTSQHVGMIKRQLPANALCTQHKHVTVNCWGVNEPSNNPKPTGRFD